MSQAVLLLAKQVQVELIRHWPLEGSEERAAGMKLTLHWMWLNRKQECPEDLTIHLEQLLPQNHAESPKKG